MIAAKKYLIFSIFIKSGFVSWLYIPKLLICPGYIYHNTTGPGYIYHNTTGPGYIYQ